MVASIEIWNEGFNLLDVIDTSDTVVSHTATSVDVAGTPWTTNQYVGYSIKFTSGALDGNGYVITSNDTNTITCSAADFSTLVNGETFDIIEAGEILSSTGAPVTEIELTDEEIATLPQVFNESFIDPFTLDDTGAPTGVFYLTGTVYDANGNRVPEADIHIVNGAQYHLLSDVNGDYSTFIIENIYQMKASKYGYNSHQLEIEITEDTTQDFTLGQTGAAVSSGHSGARKILKLSHRQVSIRQGRNW